jgi:hypothetical protein
MLQSASKLLIIADYSLHKEFIAKNLCENKAKPMMHCNGKCHLRKALQKEEKKNNEENSLKEKFEVQFFSQTNKIIFSASSSEIKKGNTAYSSGVSVSHLNRVFHPPCRS